MCLEKKIKFLKNFKKPESKAKSLSKLFVTCSDSPVKEDSSTLRSLL